MKTSLFILIAFLKLFLIIYMVILIIKNLSSAQSIKDKIQRIIKKFLITIGILVVLTVFEFTISFFMKK